MIDAWQSSVGSWHGLSAGLRANAGRWAEWRGKMQFLADFVPVGDFLPVGNHFANNVATRGKQFEASPPFNRTTIHSSDTVAIGNHVS